MGAAMNELSFSEHFRVHPGNDVDLGAIDSAYHGKQQDKDEARKMIRHLGRRLQELQYCLYAENRHSLLICLQAMDAGGKDGVIRHVFGYMNPQGCRVQGFKTPTETERARDFLWRVHRVVPASGEVVIFNRSHYEDVLIARVHELVPRAVWEQRYDRINEFEGLLRDSGTHVLKFFLHISPEEQLRRFKKRLRDPQRQWKISEADYTERRYWTDYQCAYEEALGRCSTAAAPWYIIPADHKWFRNLVVSQIVVDYLESLDIRFPPPVVDLDAIRRQYHRRQR
jgi:PPK2 family polyphosphate:nucleotide phosphotransferase